MIGRWSGLVLASVLAFSPAQAASGPAEATALAFGDLFEPGGTELLPSDKLLRLNGGRVRMVGFMVDTELPPRGGFYLTAFPLSCDEAGGGTADLPPEHVFVVVRSAAGKALAHRAGPLVVTGLLELGPHEDEDGRVSAIRIVLDRPSPRGASSRKRKNPPPPAGRKDGTK